ncbi:MAG: Hsp33 family molecular chaperone HslO [Alphaproteobacteria bacterium]|nr:MAG: Hsp33 family molecular chaperone HslO [Alphaproteobacteria bacterium]
MVVLENLVIPFQINNKIKGTIVRLSSVASQIINDKYPKNINSIFADSISITASIGSRMKNDGVFSFQAHSEGVIKTIFVDLNYNSSVRGYISVNNFENIENLPFEKLISNGILALNIKEGKFSKNYQGLVEIKGKSIKDAIDTYFNSSEQVKSFFKLFNIFNLTKYEPESNYIAGAIKLELMPEINDFNNTEKPNEDWKTILMFLETMNSEEFLNINKTSKQILLNLFGQYEIKIFDEINLNNNCQCSNERVLNTLKSMDKKEIKYLFNKKKSIEVVCEFCKTKRVYSEQDLK